MDIEKKNKIEKSIENNIPLQKPQIQAVIRTCFYYYYG